MLKKLLNLASVKMTIEPIDPLLIKSGQATVSNVDMAFVQTFRHDGKLEPFIPGSSLKGVMRSHAEKICRSLRDEPVPVCLPYLEPDEESEGEANQASCGLRMRKIFENDKKRPSPDIYRISCAACRLFGSHYFIGRYAVGDGYITEKCRKGKGPLLEVRDGVAIDRLTGGTAGGAKFDLQVLTRGDFEAQIEVRNFERWQLGMLALILRDMQDELIHIGFGKSRGLGRIRAKIDSFEISYYGKEQNSLVGLYALCSEKERASYGLVSETNGNMALENPEKSGLRYRYDITHSWKDLLEPAVNDFIQYIAEDQWPAKIVAYFDRNR